MDVKGELRCPELVTLNTYCLAMFGSRTSMTALYTDPIWISEHSPFWGVEAVKTGVSWQEPDPTPIMTRNCSGTALNGLMLLKFVVPAGKSSKVKVTTYVPDAPSPPL